jgi:hypothetical protein
VKKYKFSDHLAIHVRMVPDTDAQCRETFGLLKKKAARYGL